MTFTNILVDVFFSAYTIILLTKIWVSAVLDGT